VAKTTATARSMAAAVDLMRFADDIAGLAGC
jgi:hypothetical protein